MSDPLCPSCKTAIRSVRPVRLPTDPDTKRWTGPVPTALGFACTNCNALLPLNPEPDRR
jgi:hypothetical protein